MSYLFIWYIGTLVAYGIASEDESKPTTKEQFAILFYAFCFWPVFIGVTIGMIANKRK